MFLRKKDKNPETNNGIADSHSNDPEEECQKHQFKSKLKMKMPDFMKRQKNSKCPETTSVDLDVNEYLKQNRLAEAQQQLVKAEERLYGSNEEVRAEDEGDKLQEDHEIFIGRLRLAIYNSFEENNQEILKSALTSILQEEAQDRHWAEVAMDQRPTWRPSNCRQIHDTLIVTVVEERMKISVEQENNAEKLSTSLKTEVCRMGKQVQNDLLCVVQNLRECYPPDFDICRTYAQLYHQAFSTRLQELTRSITDFEDCHYILTWIMDYYPKDVLNHEELKEHISSSSLGPLLPEEEFKRLEDQYFSYKENEIRKWLFNALEKEVKKWSDGIEPELDGYYFSNLAVDVLPLVDITVREVNALLGCESKAWSLLWQLHSFLLSYKTSLQELVKRKEGNLPKTLSANLVAIHQIRDYVQRPEHSFPEDARTAHLSTLADLKNTCHSYFLRRIHTELKPLYRKLWTQAWFAGHCEVIKQLVKALEYNIDHFEDLMPACREELLAELHVEIMVEYVRRMMKRKLKMKEKTQQEAAAKFICDDSSKICSVFAKMGCQEEWLSQVLPKLSEILRLQDPDSLQLEIVSLVRDYPDICEQHVLAVLKLKTSLSSSDICRIKTCLNENRATLETETSPSFFSKVQVKWKIM